MVYGLANFVFCFVNFVEVGVNIPSNSHDAS